MSDEKYKCIIVLLITICISIYAKAHTKPEIINYKPFVWKSLPPGDCPFHQSNALTGIKFLGIKSGFHYGDTWYPSWGTDGITNGARSWSSGFSNLGIVNEEGNPLRKATTAQAVIYGYAPTTPVAIF
ncbi:hypothetical protein ACFLR1_02455 [Bacteroidota bacterium]